MPSKLRQTALMKALKSPEWPETPSALFPGGGREIANAFSDWADAEMLNRLRKQKSARVRARVRDRIEAGVLARLAVLEPHREAVRRALRFMAPPPRHLDLPRLTWRSADAIWRAAGDTATDYNHYTKRLLLSGVLVSTTLFWLNDESPGRARTKAYLSRRIEDALKLGGIAARLKGKS